MSSFKLVSSMKLKGDHTCASAQVRAGAPQESSRPARPLILEGRMDE